MLSSCLCSVCLRCFACLANIRVICISLCNLVPAVLFVACSLCVSGCSLSGLRWFFIALVFLSFPHSRVLSCVYKREELLALLVLWLFFFCTVDARLSFTVCSLPITVFACGAAPFQGECCPAVAFGSLCGVRFCLLGCQDVLLSLSCHFFHETFEESYSVPFLLLCLGLPSTAVDSSSCSRRPLLPMSVRATALSGKLSIFSVLVARLAFVFLSILFLRSDQSPLGLCCGSPTISFI